MPTDHQEQIKSLMNLQTQLASGLASMGGDYPTPTEQMISLVDSLLAQKDKEKDADHKNLLSIIDDLTDTDGCSFDHHGYCQTHSWFETDPKCPQARIKQLEALNPSKKEGSDE